MKIHLYQTLVLVSLTSLLLIMPLTADAVVNPITQPNNQFGIHITDYHDLEAAAKLVNGNGGDWGYVTFVIRQDQMDKDSIQQKFDRMRELRLIPIVRLATQAEGAYWKKPIVERANEWADFLDGLNWVVKNRYVLLFNEPNHAKEWENSLRPDEYAIIARTYRNALKKRSDDFFVMPAALDLAAPNTAVTMSPERYFDLMYKQDPDIYTIFDGWNSHSYPNPAFSASPYLAGKMSLRGWEWELNYLRSKGLPGDIPVFITETGWVHSDGPIANNRYLPVTSVANNFVYAFEQVWNNDQVVAVTPFILSFQDGLFGHFSWKKFGSESFHEHYEVVRQIPKEAGKPIQIYEGIDMSEYLPQLLLTDSEYMVAFRFMNTGQSIWDMESVEVRMVGIQDDAIFWISQIEETKPGEEARVWLRIRTSQISERLVAQLELINQDKVFTQTAVNVFDVVSKHNPMARFRVWLERLLHKDVFVLEN